MKNSFVVIEEKVEKAPVLWIAKVLLSLFLVGRANHFEKAYEFYQYMYCTRPLGGIDKLVVCLSLRWSTTDGNISLYGGG